MEMDEQTGFEFTFLSTGSQLQEIELIRVLENLCATIL